MTTTKIDRLLLGDNPFNGVNHRSRELSRGRVSALSPQEITRVIEVALNSGAQGMVFSVTPKMLSVLRYMKENGWSNELHLYPIIPDVISFINESAELGALGFLNRLLGGLSVRNKVKLVIKGGVATLSLSPMEVVVSYLDAELSRINSVLPHGAMIRSVFLHEIITDAIVGLQIPNILPSFYNHVASKYKAVPGLVTRNFPKLVEFIRVSAFPLDSVSVMTPFNPLGFQMNPSKKVCEETLHVSNSLNLRVVAMSVLAAGRIPLIEAIDYVMRLVGSPSCVIGTSTESHARETFKLLTQRLQ